MTEHTPVGHWAVDDCDVYVGRGSGGVAMGDVRIDTRGWLGNPYKVRAYGGSYSRGESIERFRADFQERLHTDEEFKEAVYDLHGKTLGCWCQRLEEDTPACHAEVIAEFADLLNDFDPERLQDDG